MSETAIRQKVFETLNTVAGVGKTYNYERWAKDWGKFIELFKDVASGRILGCEICRSSVGSQYLSNREAEEIHGYTIKCYRVVNDAETSELLFNDLIEAIRAVFRFNFTLGGVATFVGPVAADVIDTRMFGGVLCHYAELKIHITELV